MSSTSLFKLLEVGLLLLALAAFVWWQRRDLKRAAEETARQRQLQQQLQKQPATEEERLP